MPVYFSVNNLSFRYPSYQGLESPLLFDSLSFSLQKGTVSVFLAPPGSGKTTLSRIITSLVPAYTGGTLSGSIRLDDAELTELHSSDMLNKVGIVFQNPDEQIICSTAEKEISFPLENMELPPEEISTKVQNALSKMHIEELREQVPSSLSGGQKRRLMLAVLHAVDPQLWILDETLEEIDIYARKEILETLKSSGKTVLILTSKMLDIYREFASDFFIFSHGTIEHFQPADNKLYERASELGLFINLHMPEISVLRDKFLKKPECDPVIRLQNIKFAYPDSKFSIEIEDFSLHRGKTTAVIGTNGCGKSTLSKLIAGLLIPSAGKISFMGKETDPGKLNRNVSYLFQNPDYQLFLPTVQEELEYGLKLRNKSTDPEQISDAVKIFGIESVTASPVLMSYGQKKKLQAAIYYLLNKDIIIIDEADSGISFTEYTNIIRQFRNSDKDPAIMIITHDFKLAVSNADSIYFMNNGKFEEPGDKLENILNYSFLPGEIL